MLKGISPVISPELLKVLAEMGHSDELVLGDSNFPGATMSRRLLRADGLSVSTLLEGIAPLFPFETYADPLIMMQVVASDKLDPAVEADYMQVIRRSDPSVPPPIRIEKFAFYERSRNAFAVLMTGETRLYGCLIIKKGVIA
jgi:L-fucose mutarotase